jgi:hypothetical protein
MKPGTHVTFPFPSQLGMLGGLQLPDRGDGRPCINILALSPDFACRHSAGAARSSCLPRPALSEECLRPEELSTASYALQN